MHLSAGRDYGPGSSVKPLFRRRDAFRASTTGRVQSAVPRRKPLAAYETPHTAARRNCLLPDCRLPPSRGVRDAELFAAGVQISRRVHEAAMSFDAAFASLSSKRGSALRLSRVVAHSIDSMSAMTLTRRGRGRISLRLPFCGESVSWPRAVARRGVLEPTGARGNRRLSVVRAVHEPTRSESEGEHVRGPDVISTATVKGAREGARVEIMSYPPKERSD